MKDLKPIPIVGEEYWFYYNDQIKKDCEYKAIVIDVIPFENSDKNILYKYDDDEMDVVPIPLMDAWMESVDDLFWILADKTDYILRLNVPDLCAHNVYVARDLEGGWHSFETCIPKQFGILDITGEYHKKLHTN